MLTVRFVKVVCPDTDAVAKLVKPATFKEDDTVTGAAKVTVDKLPVCSRLPGIVHIDEEELPNVDAPCTVSVDNDVAPDTVTVELATTPPLNVVCPLPDCVSELEYEMGPAKDDVFVESVWFIMVDRVNGCENVDAPDTSRVLDTARLTRAV